MKREPIQSPHSSQRKPVSIYYEMPVNMGLGVPLKHGDSMTSIARAVMERK